MLINTSLIVIKSCELFSGKSTKITWFLVISGSSPSSSPSSGFMFIFSLPCKLGAFDTCCSYVISLRNKPGYILKNAK